jgi:catechol 2,3-dioxygenase
LLGFSVSEYRADEGGSVDMAWLRRTTSSHDVALGRAPRPGVHHVAFAVDGRGALSHAADALADVGMRGQIEFGPGRHGTTDAYFIYLKDPFDNRVELYYGDYHRDLDRPPVRWSTDEYDRRGRLWWGQAPPPSFAEAAPLVAPARPR